MLKKHIKKIIKKLLPNKFQPLNWIELNKHRFLNNFKILQKNNPAFNIIPVLKSNAYGHGITQIAEILNDTNCKLVAVDGYFEASKIKEITNHKILVMGYIKPENIKLLDVRKCSFVVQDLQSLIAFGALKKQVNIHIELNTGMNRLGLDKKELKEYLKTLKTLPNLKVEGVMTHLADADNENNDIFTNHQVKLFDDLIEVILKQGFKPKYIHIAQTAGSTKAISKYANSIRTGIGLYGLNPLKSEDKHYHKLDELLPVLSLKSTIIKVIDLKEGDKVSYNGTFTAKKSMKIGILPLGYYEGIPRKLSNIGVVISGDNILPIIGSICMNHIMINLSSSQLKVGDSVTVFSNNPKFPNSIQQISNKNKILNYELITGLSSNIKRIIL